MKQNPKAKILTARRVQTATAAAVVVGLSATGAVYFSVGDAHAVPAISEHQSDRADRSGRSDLQRRVPRTVERTLRVRRKNVRVRPDGVEFVSKAYAAAFNTDRESVVRALSQKYSWIDARRITVRGNRIFIGSGGGGGDEAKIFENLCLVIKLNLCKKD